MAFTTNKSHPRPYEVLADVLCKPGDAKELARRLSRSPNLIRSWRRSPESDEDYSTGRHSFLDVLDETIAMVREDDGSPERAYPIGHHVARRLSGTFVADLVLSGNHDADIMQAVSSVLKETGDAVEATRKAYFEESPKRFTERERAKLNKEIREAIAALIHLRNYIQSVEG